MAANSDPKFLEAVERAKKIAEKIQREASGQKRPHEEGTSPGDDESSSAKKPVIGDIDANIKAIRHGSLGGPGLGFSDRKPSLTSSNDSNNGHHSSSTSQSHVSPPASSSAPDIPKLGEGPPLLQGIIRNGEKYLDMMIQGSKVGLIIGKGGETIRSLQDRAGVKLTIHQQVNDASEPEKQLRIIGPPDKVDRCKEMIQDLLIEKEMERANRGGGGGFMNRNQGMDQRHNEYGSSMDRGFGGDRGMRHNMNDSRPPFIPGGNSVEVAVPPNFIGLVIGKGGESIKRIQQESGTKIQFDTTKTDNRGNKICCISGTPDSVRRAEELIQEIIDNAASNRSTSGRFMGGEEVRFPVPANRCGAVIGRGGESIRVIKQQSGCDIELDKMAKTSADEKVFIIRGPADRIPVAQQLINEKVRGANSSPQQESSSGFGSQSGDYSFNNYIQAQHGIPPTADATAAQSETLNYYAQYYAAIAAQQQQGGPASVVPQQPTQSSNGSGAGQVAQPPSASSEATQDYTQQWIEYYRAYGMHKEADQIEAMAKASKGQPQPQDESKGTVTYPGFPYTNFVPGSSSK